MANITINGKIFEAEKGTNLGELLANERLMEMPCGGNGRCGKCRVIAAGKLNAVSETERMVLTEKEIAGGIRLACRTLIEGDCVCSCFDSTFSSEKEAAQILGIDEGNSMGILKNPAYKAYGAAIDIGSTTLAACLYSKDGKLLAETGCLNPQSVWGADVVSRIGASVAGAGMAIAETSCGSVCRLLCKLAEKAGISSSEVDGVVITGNTAMLYLLTNTPADALSHAPFDAERLFGEEVTAEKLGINALLPETKIYFPPCKSAFIGADIITALLDSEICENNSAGLLVDIGTNGEMALFNNGRILFCSTAAGPAFEGAGLSMGMGGKNGAVDHVQLCDGKFCAHVIGGETPLGICGSGVIDAVACLLESGALDETGLLENDPAVIVPPVVITQKDIRMVQLAKSAIRAGLNTLLHYSKVDCGKVEDFAVAGGFGSYLNTESAGRIGLLPTELLPRTRIIGNAALRGAVKLLLDKSRRGDCMDLIKNSDVVDLSANPFFTEAYMEEMMF